MKDANLFGRLISAIVTPFDASGEVDYAAFDEIATWQLDNGTDTLCVCGTTGESPTLSVPEKLALFGRAATLVHGRGKKIIANVGSNNTLASVEFARQANALGVDGIMAVVPYYNKPSQRGMLAHFKAIADAVAPTPVVIYNIPGRCVVDIHADTFIELMQECPNVRAMKEAAIQLDVDREIFAGAPDDFEMFSGNDEKTLDLMGIGASGVISTTSNVMPAEMAQMVNLFAEGRTKEAQDLHERLYALMTGLFKAPNPTLVKEAMRMVGHPAGGLRLPMVAPTEQECAFIRDVLVSCGAQVLA